MYTFQVGMKVRILLPLREGIEQQGTIYNYMPSRPYPWHVLPDNYDDIYGIAFTEAEIEPSEAKDG
jgi:hypothetical protein